MSVSRQETFECEVLERRPWPRLISCPSNESMFSQNLDIIFTEKISKIYNNVIYKSENFTLNTDEVFIDMVTGDIKLQMKNKKDKVKLTASNELIN